MCAQWTRESYGTNDAESICSLMLTPVDLSGLKIPTSACLDSDSNALGTDVEAGSNLVILPDKLGGQICLIPSQVIEGYDTLHYHCRSE